MFRAIPINGRGTLTSFWGLFWILVCLHQLYFGWFMVRSSFVPYVMDGNETFSVWWHAHNLYTFSFWKSLGLTDESYGLTEASHPFFHTHQGNMPRLFGFLIYALGARTVEAQVLITTLVIGNLTLFFCYASIAKITRPAIAFVFCLFLFSDYLLYAQWHVVTYRVWYGFIFFGTLFAISNATPENRIWPYALLGLLFFLLFYFELVFAGYVSIATGLYVLWLHWGSPKRIAALYGVQLIAGVAALALLFSQLVLALGVDVVKADFSKTFLARNAFVAGTAIDASFFRDSNIVFWNNLRDGSLLRTIAVFAKSFGTYIFQIWTPPFFILVVIPFIGVIVSFIERKSRGLAPAAGNFVARRGPIGGLSYVVGIVAPRRFAITIPRTLSQARLVPWLSCAFIVTLVLQSTAISGALFGIPPTPAPAVFWSALTGVAALTSAIFLVFAFWIDRPSWMSVSRGVLTAALGALIIANNRLMFDQTYSDIWVPLFQDWKIRLILRTATVLTFLAACGISAAGAGQSFGFSRKAALFRATAFFFLVLISYTCIYILSPGYVLSGYTERYAPFAIFFVTMIPALGAYALTAAGGRYVQWVFADYQFAKRWRKPAAVAVLVLVGVPIALWTKVQLYYVSIFPPDHVAFLQKLKSPPFRHATFAVSNYAAPVAYFAGNWAYFDTEVANATGVPGKFGDERLTDGSSRWFADWKSNPKYEHPDFFVCMRMKSFASTLFERYPARTGLPRFCNEDRILNPSLPLSGELIASDFASPKFWSVVALDTGRPKVAAVSTTTRFHEGRWLINNQFQIERNSIYPPTSTEVQLFALPKETSCNVPKQNFKMIGTNSDDLGFALPSGFTGAFFVRGKVGSEIGDSKWASGDLWIVKPESSSISVAPFRCRVTIAHEIFNSEGPQLQQQGWAIPEPWGTWTDGSRATLRPFSIPTVALNSDFILEAKVRVFTGRPGQIQNVTLRANGIVVANWALTDAKPEYEVRARITNSVLAGQKALSLSFDISNPASPADVGLSTDRRQLGMGLLEFQLKEADR